MARVSASRGASRLVACAISDDVYTTRNAERKLLIRYPLILLQIAERERRFSALPVLGRQRADLECCRVYRHDEVLVFRFALSRRQLQSHRSRSRVLDVCGGEIAADVALPGQEERGRRGLVVRRDVADDHLPVL